MTSDTLAGIRKLAVALIQQGPALDELPSVREPGQLADSYANFLIIEAGDRQRVLEAQDIGERVRLCTEALAVQQALLTAPSTPSWRAQKGKGPVTPAFPYRCSLPGLTGFELRCRRAHNEPSKGDLTHGEPPVQRWRRPGR